MVAVSVEIEGPLKAVRDIIFTIESQTPLLFVPSASFRSLADGGEGSIRAELRVQGAIRDGSQPSGREAALGGVHPAERTP
jgi:general secretion pathway protein M